MKLSKLNKGFTLIELLVVIGILGILLTIVLIAINPARQFAQADNTKRASDVSQLLNAVHQYAADHKGKLPTNMPAKGAAAANVSSTGANICAELSPTYLSLLPSDPQAANGGVGVSDCTAAYDTEYTVQVDATGRVTVSAPSTDTTVTDNATVISVTR